MFDSYPTEPRIGLLDRIRHYFRDHGPDLMLAASLLGGDAAERRVISCALRLETAHRMDPRLRRELRAIHRLLSPDAVGDPDAIETVLFLNLKPGSMVVENICWLTDRLDELLREVDVAAEPRPSVGSRALRAPPDMRARSPRPGGRALTPGHSGCACDEVPYVHEANIPTRTGARRSGDKRGPARP